MYVVIFRATIRGLDEEYSQIAAKMRNLALSRFGCLAFHTVMEGRNEVALSYWPNEEAIRAWKAHPEHILAQRAGRERWYASYSVQVATVTREYGNLQLLSPTHLAP